MTDTAYAKPLPTIGDDNRPFWEAARAGRLELQHCSACGHVRYPIAPVCPDCLHDGHAWRAVSGLGTVFSTIVFHQVYHPGFAGDVPYNVSLIQLDEGPRMFSNVIGVPPSSIKVGQRVRVVFDAVTSEVSLPRFEVIG